MQCLAVSDTEKFIWFAIDSLAVSYTILTIQCILFSHQLNTKTTFGFYLAFSDNTKASGCYLWFSRELHKKLLCNKLTADLISKGASGCLVADKSSKHSLQSGRSMCYVTYTTKKYLNLFSTLCCVGFDFMFSLCIFPPFWLAGTTLNRRALKSQLRAQWMNCSKRK